MTHYPLTGTTAALSLLWFAPSPAIAQQLIDSDKHQIRTDKIGETLEHPWGLALMPDGRFLVTERNSGRLLLGRMEGGAFQPVSGVPDTFRFKGPTGRSQGGLFHVALHPDFAENQMVYVSFSQPSDEGAGTAVARGRLSENGDNARLEGVEVVYTMNKHDSSGLHFGGRFAFHPETKNLYVTVGERRNISRAQDAEDHAGSVIRVRDDGSVPDDNPFVAKADHDDKIHSIGHRNPQGLAFHPETNELWATDHGPEGGDEINRLKAGLNYGWPFQTAGKDYSGAPIGGGKEVEGMEAPVHVFDKTVGPAGVAFYRGDMFPEWRGDMLIGGLASESLERIRIADNKVVEHESIPIGRRIRDVQTAPDGSVLLLTEHSDGEILRLTRAGAPASTGTGAADKAR
jgi:aldose sugar dehydrogenase